MEQKRKAFIVILMLLSVLAIRCPLAAAEMKATEMLDRSVLPIPEPQYRLTLLTPEKKRATDSRFTAILTKLP